MWGVCGVDTRNMKSDRDRERGTEGHRKTQTEREKNEHYREDSFLSPHLQTLYKEILVLHLDPLGITC